MAFTNPGPSKTTTVNTQTPYSPEITIQTIAVNLTPGSAGVGTTEQTFSGLNTGIKAGDVIVGVSPPGPPAATAAVINGRIDPAVDDRFYLQFVATTAVAPSAGLYLLTIARFNQSTRPPGSTTYSFVPTSVVP